MPISSKMVASCLTLLFITACTKDPEPNKPPPSNNYSVQRLQVTQQRVAQVYTVPGTVISDNRVQVTSRITGYIQAINVREGERVQQGQILAMLDNRDVEGTIAQSKAENTKAEAALQDTITDVKHFESLFAKGVVSETTLRKARLARTVAKDNLKASTAAMNTAISQRQYTSIVSPVSGLVVARPKRNGDLATPGTPILTVESDSLLLFETHIAEQRISDIKPGMPVIITIDALSQPVAGKVSRVVFSGNPITRRFQVKISLPKTDQLLLAGMFGRASFTTGDYDAIRIPKTAIIHRGGIDGVYTIDANNRAHFRWIRTGKQGDESVEITSGLLANETIVLQPPATLRDGDTVENAASQS